MRLTKVLLMTAAAVGLSALAPAGDAGSNRGWEKLKSLAGEWRGTYEGKNPVHVTYTLVSGGTALMEAMDMPGDSPMITMYAPDGDRIVATHYCHAGNQPRIRATPDAAAPGRLAFDFVDATNVSSPDGEMMRSLVVTFQDPDHFRQEWTSRVNGVDHTGVFEYARAKK